MKRRTSVAFGCIQFVIAILVAGLLSVVIAPAAAQTGYNAVYNSSGNCTSTSGCTPSPAFIDASQFTASGRDFCGVLNRILNPQNHILMSVRGVIDARGLPGSTG